MLDKGSFDLTQFFSTCHFKLFFEKVKSIWEFFRFPAERCCLMKYCFWAKCMYKLFFCQNLKSKWKDNCVFGSSGSRSALFSGDATGAVSVLLQPRIGQREGGDTVKKSSAEEIDWGRVGIAEKSFFVVCQGQTAEEEEEEEGIFRLCVDGKVVGGASSPDKAQRFPPRSRPCSCSFLIGHVHSSEDCATISTTLILPRIVCTVLHSTEGGKANKLSNLTSKYVPVYVPESDSPSFV